jgi:ABC-2 type transport system permease protein
MKINQAVSTLAQASQMNQSNSNSLMKAPTINTEYIYGNSETTIFDIFSPILIAFFVFFFVFLISGIGLLRERTTGTLERLMSTPIKKSEVVGGYLIGYGIFAVLQTLVIIFFSIKVLNIILVGSVGYVILTNLLSALVALSLGILLSTFASSEFQMVQFIPVVIVPQVFFSGIFPTEGMADWLRAIGKVMPLTYAGDALKGVMYKGWGFSEIKGDLFALTIFAVIFIGLNIVVLRKYRKV